MYLTNITILPKVGYVQMYVCRPKIISLGVRLPGFWIPATPYFWHFG